MIAVAHVICPVDRSPASLQALRHAFRLARRYGARVRVVHVAPAAASRIAPGTASPEAIPPSVEETRNDIARFVAQVENPGVPVDIDIVEGDPADAVLELAARDTHTVVVMGTHGRTGVSRMILGSVAERIARKTTRPLLIVPPHDETLSTAGGDASEMFARILCAVDLRASSLAALRAALAIARETDAIVDVVSVLDIPPEDEARRIESEAGMTRRAQAWTQRLRTLHDLVPDEARQSCWVYEHVRAGEPAPELLAYAQEASSDLIVIGTGDGRHLGARWLGRTTERLMRGATAPVLIVPVARAAPMSQATFLPPESWASELARLTEQHRGAPTTLSVMTDVLGPQTEVRALPLRALTAERNNERGSIVVMLGNGDQAHLTHFVSRPIEVRLRPARTDHPNVEVLITDEDGTTTVVDVGGR